MSRVERDEQLWLKPKQHTNSKQCNNIKAARQTKYLLAIACLYCRQLADRSSKVDGMCHAGIGVNAFGFCWQIDDEMC